MKDPHNDEVSVYLKDNSIQDFHLSYAGYLDQLTRWEIRGHIKYRHDGVIKSDSFNLSALLHCMLINRGLANN